MISRTDIQKVSDLPIEQVAEALGLTVRKHWSLCPFHSDTKPSLYFRVGKNKYRCFVCDHFGGLIDLAMEILSLNFRDAVCWLAQTFFATRFIATPISPTTPIPRWSMPTIYPLNVLPSDFQTNFSFFIPNAYVTA